MPPRIISEGKDGVGWVMDDSPAQLNAFTSEMMADLRRVIERFGADDGLRAVVLRRPETRPSPPALT
jgi:enoyl-CoA hydratase/carnithine racemase